MDYVGEWDALATIADWKTSKTPKNENWASVRDYKLQCAAYALMHNEMFHTDIRDIRVVIACETGEVQVFKGKVADLTPELLLRIDAYYALPAAA